MTDIRTFKMYQIAFKTSKQNQSWHYDTIVCRLNRSSALMPSKMRLGVHASVPASTRRFPIAFDFKNDSTKYNGELTHPTNILLILEINFVS